MNDLPAVLMQAFALLREGATEAASAFRTPALATAALEALAAPGLRTIVLRRFAEGTRMVELHTDARSPKIAALRLNPISALHFWDAARRVQLRLDGRIAIAGAEPTEAAWADLPAASRATYAVTQAPGTPIRHPDDAKSTVNAPAPAANFSLLQLRFDELEYLSLAHGAHLRARFRWPDGSLNATWLVP